MIRKSKNGASPRRQNASLTLAVGVLALAIGGIIGGLISLQYFETSGAATALPTPEPISLGDETFIIPLNSATPIYTAHEYSGSVTLLMTGFGRVNERQYSDAFYLYLNARQEPLAPPIMQPDFMLEIDGESAATILNLNSDILPYSSTHTYLIRYNMGPDLHHIALRTTDRDIDDNTGQLQVTILSDVSGLTTFSLSTEMTRIPSEAFEATEGSEMVVVPFISGSPIYTETLYSGVVMLVIRGTGQAAGTDYSDAFYLYERPDHSPYVPPQLGDFAMELDGRRINEVLNIAPPYAWNHTYRVRYDVGRTPRRIGFRNTDITTGDNHGTYFVEVIPGG